jgi:hypothetical protein
MYFNYIKSNAKILVIDNPSHKKKEKKKKKEKESSHFRVDTDDSKIIPWYDERKDN